jgi:predicted PurR-regulated permease PerM
MIQDQLYYAILIFGIGWLIFTYQVLLGPLVISLLIAYLLYPGVTWISNHTKIDLRRIVPIIYLIFITILVLVIIILAPIIARQFNQLTEQMRWLQDQVEIIQFNLERFLGFSLPLDSFFAELEADTAHLLRPERVFRILQGASTNIVWVIIIFITSFHLLRDWPRLREWFFGLFPEQYETDLRHLHQDLKAIWQAYLRGQLLIMAILGILSGIGAAAVGVPGALLLGILAGALALIPNLGPATATGIAALVAWTQGSAYYDISNQVATLIVVSIFLGIQTLEGFWLTPRIMSRRLNFHPGLILIAVVGTLFTLGALAALIIIPLMGSIDLVLRYVRRKRAGLDPWPMPESLQIHDGEEK